MGVEVGPVIREPPQVSPRDEVLGFLLGGVETIEDHPDEEIQKHKRDRERKAGGNREEVFEGGGGGKGERGGWDWEGRGA